MTRVQSVTVTCPACGNEGNYDHYSSANVTLDPILKECVLDNSLFTFECANCGESALVETDCLYHDMDKRLLYQLTPEADSDEQLKDVLQQINDFGANFSFVREGYRIRVVPSLSDLKEKIIISDAELNDQVIELLKVYVEAMALEQAEDEEFIEVRFLSRKDDVLLFGVFGEEDFSGDASIPIKVYEEECLRHDFEDDEKCYLIDREWALRKMGLSRV